MDGLARLWRRYRESRTRDIVLALVMTFITTLGTYGEAHPTQKADKVQFHGPIPAPTTAELLLVVIAGLVLAVWRRYPLTVLTISTTAVAIYSALGYVNGAALLSPTVALYGAAKVVSVKRATIAAGLTLAVLMWSTAVGSPFGTGGGFFLIPALISAGLFGGMAVRNRQAYIASIQDRADEAAKRRVDEERLRIARELHDVVAHTMATINVQASAAAQVMRTQPDEASRSLQAIRKASKEGLRELRAILDVLRQSDEAEPTQPAPGLDLVNTLIDGAAQAGLPAELCVTGTPAPLPPAADLAAYRIIQESLTNAIRHAGPATATVSLDYAGSELRIAVADTGRGSTGPDQQTSTGHGLIGMRERAASVGGTVQAGSGRDGGFLVSARLPYEPSTGSAAPSAEPVRDGEMA